MRPVAVTWRDDGLFRLILQTVWLLLTGGHVLSFPPHGHIGRVSGSFPDTGRVRLFPRSIRMRRLQRRAGTLNARLWRLTCAWGTRRPVSLPRRYGPLSGHNGSGPGAGGVGGSILQTGTISTSRR